MLVIPRRPFQGPVTPQQGPFPESKLVAGPFAGVVDREPRRLVGRHVEDDHDGACIDGVSEAEQISRDPELLDRPPDLRAAEPQLLR